MRTDAAFLPEGVLSASCAPSKAEAALDIGLAVELAYNAVLRWRIAVGFLPALSSLSRRLHAERSPGSLNQCGSTFGVSDKSSLPTIGNEMSNRPMSILREVIPIS